MNDENLHFMSRTKMLILITIFSAVPCGLYNIMFFTSYNNYLYTSIAKFILFLGFPIAFLSITKCTKIKNILSMSGNKKLLKISGILGVFCAIIIIIGFIIMGRLFDNEQIIKGLSSEGITKSTYPFVFVNIVFVNAFLEEFFFRGFVFLTIYKMDYKLFAYLYSSVLFSLYHISMIQAWFSPLMFLVCMVGLVGAGLIFSEIDKRCDNIYGGYFIHLGANIGINLIGAYLFLK